MNTEFCTGIDNANKNKFEDMWHDIKCTFDFDRVYKVMKATDWTWGQGERASIPSPKMIEARARDLCMEVFKNKTTIETAGFSANYDGFNLFLCFYIESTESNN